MTRTHIAGILPIVLTGMALAGTTPLAQVPAIETADVLQQYCVSCHNDRLKTADLSLDRLNPVKVQENPAAWEKVVRKLRTGTMPPPGNPRPALEVYDATASFLE